MTESEETLSRVYEVGYHVSPVASEDDVERLVGSIRAEIEKAGGTFIAEGAPSMVRLAYAIPTREGSKRSEHDKAYFGWIKFEADTQVARALDDALKQNENIIRFIIFKTVREDTRAKMKAPTLREVKRTDTIRTTPRRVEEKAGPVSEAELEKALQDITQE